MLNIVLILIVLKAQYCQENVENSISKHRPQLGRLLQDLLTALVWNKSEVS